MGFVSQRKRSKDELFRLAGVVTVAQRGMRSAADAIEKCSCIPSFDMHSVLRETADALEEVIALIRELEAD